MTTTRPPGSLYDVLHSSVVTDRSLFKMVVQTTRGLAYLHSQNVLHLGEASTGHVASPAVALTICVAEPE